MACHARRGDRLGLTQHLGLHAERCRNRGPAIFRYFKPESATENRNLRRRRRWRLQLTGGGRHRFAVDHQHVAAGIFAATRTGTLCSARCAATVASTADLGEANAAHAPSPVCA